MNLNSVTIETERLLLKPVSLEYAKEINAGLDEEVTKYMFPKPAPLEATQAWIEKKLDTMKEGKELVVAILNKETGEYLGGGGVHHLDTRTPEFGIWIKKSAHGNHYGHEAVAGLKKWAEENFDYDYLKYPAHPDNIASRKVAESIGGKLVGEEYMEKDAAGNDLPLVDYHIIN